MICISYNALDAPISQFRNPTAGSIPRKINLTRLDFRALNNIYKYAWEQFNVINYYVVVFPVT